MSKRVGLRYVAAARGASLGPKPIVVVGPNVVDSNIYGNITDFQNPQRRIIYGSGLFWLFYYDASARLVYRTSPDGVTWSAPTVYSSSFVTYSIFNKASTIHITYTGEQATKPLYYRQGTLNTNGTITWGTEIAITVSATNHYESPVVVLDSNSIPWVAYHYYTGPGTGGIYVVQATDATGATWGTLTLIESGYGAPPGLVALSSGQMYIIYLLSALRGAYYNGSSWGSPITIDANGNNHSELVISDVIYLLYSAGLANAVYFNTWTVSGGWGTPFSVDTASNGTVSLGRDYSKLYAYWQRPTSVPYVLYQRQYTLSSKTWASITVIEDDTAAGYSMDVVLGGTAGYSDNNHRAITFTVYVTSYVLKFYGG